MVQPFEGVRVVDFSRVVAGPYGAQQLAFLGADIVKIEDPGGDLLRGTSANRPLADRGLSPMFMALNAGKRSICLDLKQPGAKAVVRRLVAGADVLVENFRPGVMRRLGFDYASVAAINPGIVYCSVSGFGQTGPEASAPAYDGKIQATSGIMSITGHPATGPTRAGFAVVDSAAGMSAAFAIAGALYQRMRTGQGQHIDVAMLDAALSFMSPNVGDVLNGGARTRLYGNNAISGRPTADLFATGDGQLLLACNTEGQYRALCAEIGRPDLLTDPRFTDWTKRMAAYADMQAELTRAFAADAAKSWEARLTKAGVPAACILGLDEAARHPQAVHRELLMELPGPPGLDGTVKVVGSPFTFAHDGPGTTRPPPGIGEHTDAILAELGYDAAAIAGLRAEGALGPAA